MKPKKIKKRDLKEEINEKLAGTGFTFEILETKYSNDTIFHVLFDLKGQSIWFNQSFMEYTKRTPNDYLKPNYLDNILNLNPGHPFGGLFKNVLQDQPKEIIRNII